MAPPTAGTAGGGSRLETGTTVAAGQVSLRPAARRGRADAHPRASSADRRAGSAVDCAGDGVTSPGHARTRADRTAPACCSPTRRWPSETDQARRYKQDCIDALTSSLHDLAGLTHHAGLPG